MRQINCRISKVTLQSEDILYVNIDADEQFTVDDYYELKQAAYDLGAGKSFYHIINVGAFTLPDKKAREISCSLEGSSYKKADAYIINSLPQKLMGNLMLRINKPVVPTKFFQSLKEAQFWIDQIRENSMLFPI